MRKRRMPTLNHDEFCGVTRARGLGLRGMNSGRNQSLGDNSLFTMKQMFDSISKKKEEMVEYLRA